MQAWGDCRTYLGHRVCKCLSRNLGFPVSFPGALELIERVISLGWSWRGSGGWVQRRLRAGLWRPGLRHSFFAY